MRTGYAAGVSNQSDHLPAFHGLTDMHERLAHVKVRGDHAAAVVDVHDVAGEKEIVDQRYDAAIGCFDRFADRASKIDAEVSGSELSVEHAA